ncbi:MAG: aminotransferase class I/II-fold pyridoxal phosphate-dependent enzyme [Clostridia bacterium]|nr:aminotransferase class I/II-fold pyridoxal phosphate-dependent enzyme [Clostridia bacterium]
MNTPIVDFVKKYAENGVSRLHMPGHKGVSFLGCENLDITEINGADALYQAQGIIAESEKNATSLFGSLGTFYSAGGSSQSIKAMMALAKNGKQDFTVLAARNVHKSFVYACALLDIKVRWLFDENENFSLCRCNITPEQLEKELKKEKADAVYITSPDYLGGMNDITSLTEIAHKYEALMLVDNAHGAYLRFLSESLHPINLGVDMCCDSAHKTLPVLTGGAYLHINNEKFIKGAKSALEMFGSTSPSYLILQSLDMCNAYLSNGYKEKLQICIKKIENLKRELGRNGWETLESDPLKLTVLTKGTDFAEKLRNSGVECEYEDPDYTVMMFTPETDDATYKKVVDAAGKCAENITTANLHMTVPEKVLSIRESIFSDNEEIDLNDSVGHIVADTSVGCPPAVSVLVAGEKITAEALKVMQYYGIYNIKVIK